MSLFDSYASNPVRTEGAQLHPCPTLAFGNLPCVGARVLWLEHLHDVDVSAQTYKAYALDLTLFSSYLGDQAVGSITSEEFACFVHWLRFERGVPYSPKSLERRVVTLKNFFRFMAQCGVSHNPSAQLPMPRTHSLLSRFLYAHQVASYGPFFTFRGV